MIIVEGSNTYSLEISFISHSYNTSYKLVLPAGSIRIEGTRFNTNSWTILFMIVYNVE